MRQDIDAPLLMDKARHCHECGRTIPVGAIALAVVVAGKIEKLLCDEHCRNCMDARIWLATQKKNR